MLQEGMITSGFIRIRDVLNYVGDKHDLGYAEIAGDCRARRLTEPRQIAMYLAVKVTGRSTTAVGRIFRRDHTTVIYSIRKIRERLAWDVKLKKMLEAMQAELMSKFNVGNGEEDEPIWRPNESGSKRGAARNAGRDSAHPGG